MLSWPSCILAICSRRRQRSTSKAAAWHPPFNLVWLLPLLAFVFFDLVMKLIRCRASQDHKHMQAHQAEDALTDASAITVSFLLVQAVCYHMSTECELCRSGDVKCRRECEARRFMPITHGEFGHHIDWCVVWLVLLACGLIGLAFSSAHPLHILCFSEFETGFPTHRQDLSPPGVPKLTGMT